MALVSVTFDNLGEAAEMGSGSYEGKLGEHFTVVEVLPRLLELLDRHGLHATFFVEAYNAEANPRALAGIRDGGHEVACHAWQHENWGDLEPGRERELLERCAAALDHPVGFRPPGGQLNDQTPALLRELGFAYASPAGSRAGVLDGVAMLPFRWPLIDAYFYLPHFSGLREANGDPEDPMEPAALREALTGALDDHREGHLPLLFHPFLVSMGDEVLEVMDDVLGHLAASDHECLRMDEAAARVDGEPELDTSSWM